MLVSVVLWWLGSWLVPTIAWGTEPSEFTPTVGADSSDEPRILGPLPLRNLSGLAQIFYYPVAERARTLDRSEWRWSTNLFYASINEARQFTNSGFAMDGEILRVELRADYGITDALELSVTLPVHYTTSGFLDSVIEGFHDGTGLRRSTTRRDDQFAQRITAGGKHIFDVDEDTAGLADVPIQLKYAVLSEDEFPIAAAVRGGIELPTGNSARSFGSGGVDFDLGLLLEKNFQFVSLFAIGDLLFFQRPQKFRSSGAHVRLPAYSAAVGLEAGTRTWWAVHLQLDALSGAVRSTGLSLVEKTQVVGTIGVSFVPTEATRVRVSVSEDITNAVSSDVVIFTGLEMLVR